MMDRFDMMDGYVGGGFWVLIVVLAAVLVVAVVYLLTRGREGHQVSPPSPTAMDILRERYARGEITAEQFEAAKKTLGG